MHQSTMDYERWVWLELIGFDNTQSDYGVGEYRRRTGFVPDAICLLLSSVDFVLQHEGMDQETALPPDICSRQGHEHNQDRTRQSWTNHQVRGLVAELRSQGCAVFATVFTQYHGNRHHHEWASDHPEVRAYYPRLGRRGGINSLARLQDGRLYEDVFLARLARVLEDYGFDGWHGADGYGPLSGALYDVDYSDNMVQQFVEARGVALPDAMRGSCDDAPEQAKARADWIWRHCRREWIEFYADRWAGFWTKAVDTIHALGRKAVINSAWGRAPWESLYRYGIDYRRIVDTGVDGIIVETVAAGLTIDPRCGDAERHFDFLSMLMLIKAYVPDAKLIFLHNTHDIVEHWDVLRHAPAVLEKEIYSLANVYHTRDSGQLTRCADGLLACLGDGIAAHEWAWLRERWQIAFAEPASRTVGVTLVWSDAVLHGQVDEFTETRAWGVHRILYHLMAKGAPVQTAVRVSALAALRGPILVLNPHLLGDGETEQVMAYSGGPIALVGPRPAGVPEPDAQFEDVHAPRPLWCGIYRGETAGNLDIRDDATEDLPGDPLDIVDERGYWDHLKSRRVSDAFMDACAHTLVELAGAAAIVSEAESVTLMETEQAPNVHRIALKNKRPTYATPELDMRREVRSVRILTPFPLTAIRPHGTRFSVRVPPQGIAVLEVELADAAIAQSASD